MTNRAAQRHPDRHASGVFVCWMHPDKTVGTLGYNLMRTVMHDQVARTAILDKGDVCALESSPRIAAGRNMLVRTFLAHPRQPEWMWMIDSDMEWEPDALAKLLGAADPHERPIVGGLCFTGSRGMAPYPTMYVLRTNDEGAAIPTIIGDWPRGDVMLVDATGAAFLLVHRSVFVRMAEVHRPPYPWFAETFIGEYEVGEDVTFCLRARALGLGVAVHTGVEVEHVKSYRINLAEYDRLTLEHVKATGHSEAPRLVDQPGAGGPSRSPVHVGGR